MVEEYDNEGFILKRLAQEGQTILVPLLGYSVTPRLLGPRASLARSKRPLCSEQTPRLLLSNEKYIFICKTDSSIK